MKKIVRNTTSKFIYLTYIFASNLVLKGGSLLYLKQVIRQSDINTKMVNAHFQRVFSIQNMIFLIKGILMK